MRVLKEKSLACRLLIFSMVILFAGELYIGSVNKIELDSSDERWRAVCFVETPECGWQGVLIYEGNETVTNLSTKLIYNNETIHSDVNQNTVSSFPGHLSYRTQLAALRANEKDKVFSTLISFADKPENITLNVTWEENGKKYEADLQY